MYCSFRSIAPTCQALRRRRSGCTQSKPTAKKQKRAPDQAKAGTGSPLAAHLTSPRALLCWYQSAVSSWQRYRYRTDINAALRLKRPDRSVSRHITCCPSAHHDCSSRNEIRCANETHICSGWASLVAAAWRCCDVGCVVVRSTKGESWLEEREAGHLPRKPCRTDFAPRKTELQLLSQHHPQATTSNSGRQRLNTPLPCSLFQLRDIKSGGYQRWKEYTPSDPEPRPPPILHLSQLPILDLPCERSKSFTTSLSTWREASDGENVAAIKVRALSCEPCDSHVPGRFCASNMQRSCPSKEVGDLLCGVSRSCSHVAQCRYRKARVGLFNWELCEVMRDCCHPRRSLTAGDGLVGSKVAIWTSAPH